MPSHVSDDQRAEEAEVRDLYRLPLADFVSGRNALAKRLRQSGDRAAADRVKALAKPSVSAWAVNQVYWLHREAFERLMESGRGVRAAQEEGGGALREASRRRRESVAESLRLAEAALREGGHAAGPGILKRVETSFESLAAYGATPPESPAGQLVEDVAPPGFEALAGLAAHPVPVPKRQSRPRQASSAKVSASDRRRRELAQRLDRADQQLDPLRKQAQASKAARDKANVAAQRDLEALTAAQRRWREAVNQLEESDAAAREAAVRWRKASERLAEAESAVEDLRRELKRTDKSK